MPELTEACLGLIRTLSPRHTRRYPAAFVCQPQSVPSCSSGVPHLSLGALQDPSACFPSFPFPVWLCHEPERSHCLAFPSVPLPVRFHFSPERSLKIEIRVTRARVVRAWYLQGDPKVLLPTSRVHLWSRSDGISPSCPLSGSPPPLAVFPRALSVRRL